MLGLVSIGHPRTSVSVSICYPSVRSGLHFPEESLQRIATNERRSARVTTIVTHCRVWRSAPFPAGILYYDDLRRVEYPVNKREALALVAERWIPLYNVPELHRPKER